MKCAVHTEVDATGFCRNCGKALCPACTREVRGALYCEPCLAGLVSAPETAQPTAKAEVHPGVALALGFIPGLGAVYNGEYIKALIHVFVFGGLIAAQSSNVPAGYHAFLGIALGCFYFYMPIEAYRTAQARRASGSVATTTGPGWAETRRPIGAIILVALGILLLLENFGLFEWDWIGKWWPLALIVLGVWMLANRMKRQA